MKENKKDRKKRAIAAVLAVRKHMKAACETFDTANDWFEFIRDNLDPVLASFDDVIPAGAITRLRDAADIADDAPLDVIEDACAGLQMELGKAAKTLTSGGGLWNYAGAVAVVGAVVGGLAYLAVSSVSIVIKNQGCEPIAPVVYMPIPLPGIDFPERPIPDGGQDTMRIPGLSFTVDGTTPGTIRLTALKITFTFTLADSGIDLLLNGQSLIGKQTTVNLGEQKTHELVMMCK